MTNRAKEADIFWCPWIQTPMGATTKEVITHLRELALERYWQIKLQAMLHQPFRLRIINVLRNSIITNNRQNMNIAFNLTNLLKIKILHITFWNIRWLSISNKLRLNNHSSIVNWIYSMRFSLIRSCCR